MHGKDHDRPEHEKEYIAAVQQLTDSCFHGLNLP
jgi:hypothetical protein